MLAWSRATQHTCCFLATWQHAHHFHIWIFGPISLSLPTVTSKAKLWPCQRTPRHRRLPHQNCLLGAMQKMEDVTSVTQKQKNVEIKDAWNMWHGLAWLVNKKVPLPKNDTQSHSLKKMHSCMLARIRIYLCNTYFLYLQFRYMQYVYSESVSITPVNSCLNSSLCRITKDPNATNHPWRGTYHFDPFWLIPLSKQPHQGVYCLHV